MIGTIPPARLRLIRRIARLAGNDSSAVVPAADFIGAYYRGVDETDLAAAPAAARAGLALQHLAAGKTRLPGQVVVRVWNPPLDDRREGSPHTRVLVVVDDMPFLVDTLAIVLRDFGATHLLVHPVLHARRDTRGRLRFVHHEPGRGTRAESWQLHEIDREVDPERLSRLEARLRQALGDLIHAVGDWQSMQQRARQLAKSLGENCPSIAPPERDEARALLAWMAADRFTFLGYRYYRLERGRQSDHLVGTPDSGLGILRGEGTGRRLSLAGAQRDLARAAEALFVTKANRRSTVHRAAYLDYIGAKEFNRRGEVVGEHRFLGLWTSGLYREPTHTIPLLRRKVARVVSALDASGDSHDSKAVQHVLETYPRDELFQANPAELLESVRGIVNLYERRQVRLFPRRDPFGRFWSCLLFVPRDRYHTQVREQIEACIQAAYGGTAVESEVVLGESALARLQLRVRTPAATASPPATALVEQQIAELLRTWADRLRAALLAGHPESQALALAHRYGEVFPLAYHEDTRAAVAVEDIAALEELAASPAHWHWRPYRQGNDAPGTLRLKLFRSGAPVPVADILPLFESLGLKLVGERPYGMRGLDAPTWIQDFELQRRSGAAVDLTNDAPRVLATLTAILEDRAETDGFNRLVLAAGLDWRQVVVLRAYAKWLLQTGMPFSQGYMEQVLESQPAMVARLVARFETAFDPALPPATRERDGGRLERELDEDLARVTRLDEDRILRGFRNAIVHTLRTNHFQRMNDGTWKTWLSFKVDALRCPDLPLPRPQFEIFVYSPRVEGVHLRKGLVARGGLRWSDRREDFRTEVLGLMKAQHVKNAVIVPVGAKGGFYCKRLPADRDALQREGIACYQTFIRGLLDLTDNRINGAIVAPPQVVRRDGDDSYLVVAADKGTASFSDIANAISLEYGHWLGDAFASGGSAGYDHKKMGITARGAWESVKRHCRELGFDPQSQDFTCAGIGDMAGDVFGNGLLQSPHTRLVAAFNHQHIFLDPEADAARGYAERARLFALPRSTWDDYDRAALGPGGGIHLRTAKSLQLSSEAQRLLGVPDGATPNDVIRAILRLPVDLLWNGGIGTYVKASQESHQAAGDRVNDAVRVDGRELRARVVGEGGNLGMTQLGRVEAALQGVRLNTDFIDNSAGVNCSDVEVNNKILLGQAIAARRLRTGERNALLAKMTDEVAALVLRNNVQQAQTLSVLSAEAAARGREHLEFMHVLESAGDLDRALEFLPDDAALQARLQGGQGLTRPELAVLLSCGKLWLFQQLMDSTVPEDPFLAAELVRYFPGPVRRRFGALAALHPLRREIVATTVCNAVVNRSGPAAIQRLASQTGTTAAEAVLGWSIAHEALGLAALWQGIEALGPQVPADVITQLLATVARHLRHAAYWVLLQRRHLGGITAAVDALQPALAGFFGALPAALGEAAKAQHVARVTMHAAAGVPATLAEQVARLEFTIPGLHVARMAERTGTSATELAPLYLGMGVLLELDWLQASIEALAVSGHWPALARMNLREQAHEVQAEFAAHALGLPGKSPAARLAAFEHRHAEPLAKLRRTLAEMRQAGAPDFATLGVALQAVRRVV